jgi:hypothetical protein
MVVREVDVGKYLLRIKQLEDAQIHRDEVHEREIKVSLLSERRTVGNNAFSI